MSIIPDKATAGRARRVDSSAPAAPVSSMEDLQQALRLPLPSVTTSVCEVCGRPIHVQVLERYTKEGPLFRRFCLACGLANIADLRQPVARKKIEPWVLVALTGVVALVIGLLGDWIIPSRHAGFGWQQLGGVLAGGIVGLLGLLVGVEIIAWAGALLMGASLAADWFGLTHGSGIGTNQQCIMGAGAACMVIAWWWKRLKTRLTPRETPKPSSRTLDSDSSLLLDQRIKTGYPNQP